MTTVISTVEYTTALISSQKQNQLTTTEQTTIASTRQPPQPPSPFFVPSICRNSTNIGVNCSFSGTLCEMLRPCKNNGFCNNINDNQSYNCSCLPGFKGTHCELDHRSCKQDTCWNDGTCNPMSESLFNCKCKPGWEGIHCERKINYCHNIVCENKGVCRPLLNNYSCECLNGSYSGRHCEIVAKRIIILQIISKSFAYVAIIAMASVAMFVVIMDILKYCFGIDPTREELERYRQEKRAKKRKPVIQRFIYVNAFPTVPSSEEPISTIAETTV